MKFFNSKDYRTCKFVKSLFHHTYLTISNLFVQIILQFFIKRICFYSPLCVYNVSLYQYNTPMSLFAIYLSINGTKHLHIYSLTTIYTFYIESKVVRKQKVVLIISISINNINQYANNVASLKHKATFQTIFTQPFDYSTKEKLLKYFQSIQTDKDSFKESNRLEAKGIFKMYFC